MTSWTPVSSFRVVGTDGGGAAEGHGLDSPFPARKGVRRRAADLKVCNDYRPWLGHAAPVVMAALAVANGGRAERTMEPRKLASLVRLLKTDPGPGAVDWLWRDGSDGYPATEAGEATTLALAVRVDGRIFLGVSPCRALNAGPWKCWAVLKGWGKGHGDEDRTARTAALVRAWVAWAADNGVIEIR